MRAFLFGLVILVTLAQPLFADKATSSEIPEKLHGAWIIDVEASAKNMKNNPKFKAEDEKRLPMMMSMLSKMSMKFTKDKLIVSMGSMNQNADATLISEKGGECQIKLQPEKGNSTELKATFTKAGKLNLSDGKGDMMNYVIWKKGTLSDSDKNMDVLGEVLREAIKGGRKEGLPSGKGKQYVKNNTKKPAAV